jgi:hypothetical protein
MVRQITSLSQSSRLSSRDHLERRQRTMADGEPTGPKDRYIHLSITAGDATVNELACGRRAARDLPLAQARGLAEDENSWSLRHPILAPTLILRKPRANSRMDS